MTKSKLSRFGETIGELQKRKHLHPMTSTREDKHLTVYIFENKKLKEIRYKDYRENTPILGLIEVALDNPNETLGF